MHDIDIEQKIINTLNPGNDYEERPVNNLAREHAEKGI